MTKITKAEFDALPDALKGEFTADGDSYILAKEDVEGLKKSKADILKEKKELQERLDAAEKFRQEHEAKQEELETAKQREAGQFAELEKKLRDKIAETEAAKEQAINDLRGTIFNERLQNMLTKKGVRPEMAKFAGIEAADAFELADDLSLRLKDGIGDAKEIDGFIADLSKRVPDFFTSQTQTGGGATGSGIGHSGQDLSNLTATQKLETYYSSQK